MSLTLASLFALLVGAVSCQLLLGYARQLQLVDHPLGRKDHDQPTPVVGGIAIYLALLCSWTWLDGFSVQSAAAGFLLAGAALVVLGAADDVRDLPWPVRIVVQSAAALILVAFGTGIHSFSLPGASLSLELGWLAIPITVFAVVGLINAINMIDGVDGLSGAIVSSTLLLMAVLASWSGNAALCAFLVVAAAAVLAFLAFNLRLPGRPKALTFLGNSGSALLGLLVAWAAIELTQGAEAQITPAVAPWLAALPILDCLTLIGRRIAGGRSPFAADRMHFHHLLLDRGLSVSQVVLAGTTLHLALAGAGLGLMALGLSDLWLIGGFLLVLGSYALIAVGMLGTGQTAEPNPELIK